MPKPNVALTYGEETPTAIPNPINTTSKTRLIMEQISPAIAMPLPAWCGLKK